MFAIFFFFSSRRRHTRCSRDWSSDVCSSDLYANLGAVYRKLGMPREARRALQRELVLRLRNLFRLKKRHRALAELAHEALRLGNPGLALRIGRRALEQDANNPRLVALLAATLRQDGS